MRKSLLFWVRQRFFRTNQKKKKKSMNNIGKRKRMDKEKKMNKLHQN